MQVKVGCRLDFNITGQTVMVLILRPANFANHQLLHELYQISPSVPLDDYLDQFGNRIWRLVASTGELQVSYDALVAVDPAPDAVLSDLGQTPVELLPCDVLPYTLPSRYCDSDLLIDDAGACLATLRPAGHASRP